ncbi:MAG: hypothetical protein QXV46_06690 [Candidatus Bathyarchaeia archaeon]
MSVSSLSAGSVDGRRLKELGDTLEEQENLNLHLHNVAWSGFSMCEDETLEAIINS